jgi:hypothetical protein
VNASEWRKKAREAAARESVELTLPSGMVIRARRPDPVQMAAWGRLPLNLAHMAQGGQLHADDVSEEAAIDMIKMWRDLLIYCCVSPRISMEPKGDDEIAPSEIPDADWKFFMGWAMRAEEAERLRPFRDRPADGVAVRDGEDVGRAAVGAAGDRGPGAGAGVRPGGDVGAAAASAAGREIRG